MTECGACKSRRTPATTLLVEGGLAESANDAMQALQHC